ncbi:MAG: hypothetical protein FD129_1292, partial [bacterium]
MRRRDVGAILMALAASMLNSPVALHASTTIERQVMAEGGRRATGGGRILVGTVGQASVGMSAGPARMLCAGFWCLAPGAVVSVEDPQLSTELEFAAPAPNPAAAVVRFEISLPRPGQVDLEVFDA